MVVKVTYRNSEHRWAASPQRSRRATNSGSRSRSSSMPMSLYEGCRSCSPSGMPRLRTRGVLSPAQRGRHRGSRLRSSTLTEASANIARLAGLASTTQSGWLLHKHRPHLTDSRKSKSCGGKGGEVVRSSSYRYVPQVAASKFARTTAADGTSHKSLAHRLSRKAFKFHLEEPKASREIATASPKAAPCQQAQAFRRVQIMRERYCGRNYFQYSSTLATMTETDEYRPLRHRSHTLRPCSETRVEGLEVQRKFTKRSTGSFPRKLDSSAKKGLSIMPVDPDAVERRHSSDPIDPSEHYPLDWTQSDEPRVQPTAPVAPPYPLRKLETKWHLRGRLRKSHFAFQGRKDAFSASWGESSTVLDEVL